MAATAAPCSFATRSPCWRKTAARRRPPAVVPMDLRRRLLGSRHWLVASSLTDLARARLELSDRGEAQSLSGQAAAILQPYCSGLNARATGERRSAREVCTDLNELRRNLAKPAQAREPKPRAVRVQTQVGTVYRAQLGSRQDAQEASRELKKIQTRLRSSLGQLPAHLETVDLGTKGIWHRLQFGDFSTYDEARALCDRIKRQEGDDCWVAGPISIR